jgi:hypothetical protein
MLMRLGVIDVAHRILDCGSDCEVNFGSQWIDIADNIKGTVSIENITKPLQSAQVR